MTTQPTISVSPLVPEDHDHWLVLARAYKDFYGTPTTDAEFAAAWERLSAEPAARTVHGLAARVDGRIVGIVHYLFHVSTWTESVCYLQDLFTADAARGKGMARALIDGVANDTRKRGATRLYWLTQSDNSIARRLYDRVAAHQGFIRYDLAL